jgi:hypothetical protein
MRGPWEGQGRKSCAGRGRDKGESLARAVGGTREKVMRGPWDGQGRKSCTGTVAGGRDEGEKDNIYLILCFPFCSLQPTIWPAVEKFLQRNLHPQPLGSWLILIPIFA